MCTGLCHRGLWGALPPHTVILVVSFAVTTSSRRQDEVSGVDGSRIDTDEGEVRHCRVSEIDHRPRPLSRDVHRRSERGRRNPKRRDIEQILPAASRIGVKTIDGAGKGKRLKHEHIVARAAVHHIVARAAGQGVAAIAPLSVSLPSAAVERVVAEPTAEDVVPGMARERVGARPPDDVFDAGDRGEARGRASRQNPPSRRHSFRHSSAYRCRPADWP